MTRRLCVNNCIYCKTRGERVRFLKRQLNAPRMPLSMSLIPSDLYAYAIEVALQAHYNKSEIEWTLASHMILYCWNNFFLLHIFFEKKEIEINVIKFFNEENELVHSNQLTFELKQISTKLVWFNQFVELLIKFEFTELFRIPKKFLWFKSIISSFL